MLYTVSEMARVTDIPASTLRYYDKEGLLPPIKRSPGGNRVFEQQDYEWLLIIECLKKAGMQLKDIRVYLQLTQQGDSTIAKRKQMFEQRRTEVRAQIESLRQTLSVLDYKCWYYEKAQADGTTTSLEHLSLAEIPSEFRDAYQLLHQLPPESRLDKTIGKAHENDRNH